MQEKCPYCHKQIEIKNSDPSRGSMHNHISNCAAYKIHINTILPKELLEKEYVTLGKSAHELSIELGIGVSPIIRKLKDYGLPTRSISESQKTIRCKEKHAKTHIEKSGVDHNFRRDHPSRVKWQQRLFDNEGITTVFQRQSVIDKIAESLASNPASRASQCGSRISGPHKKVYAYLKEIGICDVILEHGINSKSSKRKYFDLYIPSHNLIIEVNGDLFHANPEKYKPNDLIHYYWTDQDFPAHVIWEKDRDKIEIALQAKHNVLIVWENDINRRWNDIKGKIDSIFNGDTNASTTAQICEESIQYLRKV